MSLTSEANTERALADSASSPLLFLQNFKRTALRVIFAMGLDLLFVLLMALVLGITLWSHGAQVKFSQKTVLYPLGMMAFLLLTRSALWIYRHFQGKNGLLSLQKVFLQTLRDWTPFIIIDFIYENLHDLSRYFQTHDVAGAIMALDMKIFGVELTQFSQRFFHPWLTDYMAFAYALYFIFPLIIMYFLSYRNLRSELREIILALSIAFLLGFLGYVFFPCSPPRYFLETSYTSPPHLYGVFIFQALQDKWDGLSSIRSGAFPSLHVGISTIALIYAFRLRKRSRLDRWIYWIYLPLVASLWVSTVYLRHHWFIDILAGWILAAFACWISPIVMRRWEEWRRSFESSPLNDP